MTHHQALAIVIDWIDKKLPFLVVVIFNAPSWLSGVLCYCGYQPAHAQQAPLWGGAFKGRLQRSRVEGGG